MLPVSRVRDRAIVACPRALVVDAGEELRRTVDALLAGPAAVIVLDMAGTALVDSVALGAMLHAHFAADRQGCALVLRDVRPRVARILHLAGLDVVFTLTRSAGSSD